MVSLVGVSSLTVMLGVWRRNLGAGKGTSGSLTAPVAPPGEKSSVDLLFRKSVEDVATVSSLLLRVRRFNELFRRGMALPRITREVEELEELEEVLGWNDDSTTRNLPIRFAVTGL